MFIRVRVGAIMSHYVAPGSFEVGCVHYGEQSEFRVHSCSRGLTLARVAVVGFI